MISLFALLILMVPVPQSSEGPRRAMPVRSLGELINADDYPVDAVIRNAEGVVRVTLAIDENGLPIGCRVEEAAAEPSLNIATCDLLMARAKFTPALDKGGQAVTDIHIARVAWKLPANVDEKMPFEAYEHIVRVRSTPQGVTHCEVGDDSDTLRSYPRNACLMMVGREMVDSAELRQSHVILSMTTSFIPEGQQLAQTDGLGAVMFEEVSSLQVAPDGSVAHCQVLTRADHGGSTGENLSACAELRREKEPFAPAADSRQTRRARLISRLHIQSGDVDDPAMKPTN